MTPILLHINYPRFPVLQPVVRVRTAALALFLPPPSEGAIMTADRRAGLTDAMRQHLETLHRALLHLHKLLLDDERATYEKSHGRTPAGKMLQLVIGDPQFAWLRRISELIVQIDELLESDEPGAETDASDLMKQIRTLLVVGDGADEFSQKYQAALQRLPQAILAHKDVRALLPSDS